MSKTGNISFTFNGGIASEGQLNFYEAGRFLYGAARLVYTIEAFRQTGRVKERLSGKIPVDIRVGTPTRSCFVQDALLLAAPLITETFFKVPFEVMFARVWSMFGIGSRHDEAIAQAAATELCKQADNVIAATEQTRQLEILAGMHERSMDRVLGVLSDAVNQRRLPDMEMPLRETRENLEARRKTSRITAPYEDELSQITPEQERRLTSRLRGPISDLALPLRGSAESLSIGFVANDNTCAFLTKDTVNWITNTQLDKIPTPLLVRVKNFDRETGHGKFRYGDNQKALPFRLPSSSKRAVLNNLIDGMKIDKIMVSGYFTRDKSKTPISYVIDDVLDISKDSF
ncbi:DUF7946 domain-containing protein [Marinimicrococcus flavescens]|uniref:DUF7946 domain-containing protein n=1 Tax=Marinimicrococcus flavescens TaxID=3031815 RepID=A0AAP4D594_9PROT|nr:hypothetical protein [Marinimicrococcus flavescens]